MTTKDGFFAPLVILGVVLFCTVIWVAGDIFALFAIAFTFAFLFEPLTSRLERRGVPRGIGALMITAVLVIVIVGVAVLMGPMLYAQLKDLLQVLRGLAMDLAGRVSDLLSPYLPGLGKDGLAGLLKPTQKPVETLAAPIAARVFSGGVAMVGVMALSLLLPIITYYLLKDWHVMGRGMESLVPHSHRGQFNALTREINRVLSAFLHGQAWICVIDGVLYSIGLVIVGLQYGLVVGIIAGALKFLPYIGTFIGLTISLGVAIGQGAAGGWMLIGIGITFASVELVENMLYPRLVGDRVRLPPVLVIFAVLLGGKLLGIIGVFVAVPIFAIGRVVVVFWLRHRAGNGEDKKTEEPETPPPRAKKAARSSRSAVH